MKYYNILGISILAMILFISGCGGGGSITVANTGGGIGGTGVAASGTITGFGSIFVNGVEYQTDQASIVINDQPALASQLKLGMKVTVKANVNNNVASATSVVFDFEAEGPVTGLSTSLDGSSKQFLVMGITVKVDQTTTVFDNETVFNFSTLANNQLVKVSGLFDANSVLIANYIESGGTFVTDSSTVEIKGSITNLTGSNFSLGLINVIGGSAMLESLPNGLSNGVSVEVKGTLSGGTTLNATRIQGEQEDFSGFSGNVELEGYVTEFVSLSSFKVAGHAVNANTATIKPSVFAMANGIKVEVNGSFANNILMATEVSTKDEDIKLHGIVSAISTSLKQVTLVIGTDTIIVSSDISTLFDDGTGVVENMTFANLFVGDYLEIRASKVDRAVLASTIKRDGVDNHIIEGLVDSVSLNGITILGLTLNLVDGKTVYLNESHNSLTTSDFLASVSAGSKVKVKDKLPVDGVADEVTLE